MITSKCSIVTQGIFLFVMALMGCDGSPTDKNSNEAGNPTGEHPAKAQEQPTYDFPNGEYALLVKFEGKPSSFWGDGQAMVLYESKGKRVLTIVIGRGELGASAELHLKDNRFSAHFKPHADHDSEACTLEGKLIAEKHVEGSITIEDMDKTKHRGSFEIQDYSTFEKNKAETQLKTITSPLKKKLFRISRHYRVDPKVAEIINTISEDDIPELIRYLGYDLSDDEAEVYGMVASHVLQKMGSKDIEPLIEALRNDNEYIRARSASILGHIGPASDEIVALVIPALIKCLARLYYARSASATFPE